ncbi:hypothetical protein [Pseudonocardia endophytica]|uniref:Uncharacterized protein n=1 Tax=Pseudonocardia endophytica TaxID=401976 RepID=A0A4V2PHG6_PSEEN|nr:hypothetical protein [Pseudonocardia endophytica]TCK20646.1 hypothetical protein EV378_4607 [Pseudonocardia endophytica]
MALANILSEMPDLLRRTLDEHTPDAQGYCRECRDASGVSAAWPCVTRQLAEEAENMAGSGRSPVATERPSVAGRRRARDLSSSSDLL